MIFGFNTDIKVTDTVYHVQSEAREADRLLQTQVFVKGQCIGKVASSYAALTEQPGFCEAQMHEMLKAQHRAMVEAVRAGRVEEALGMRPAVAAAAARAAAMDQTQRIPLPVVASDPGPAFTLQFLNPDSVYGHNTVSLCFRVTDNNAPVGGAKLVSRFSTHAPDGTETATVFAQAVTTEDGIGEMNMNITPGISIVNAVVLVQATYESKIATRKFRLRAPRQ